jgi:anaerobic magnesium-protoporphyrin IX monomethyl ester cyclase
MDILLAHGYFIAEDEHERAIMKPYPTLGLLYIASHLKDKGFDVDLFDATFQSMAAFIAYVRDKRPSIVGLYCNLMTKQNILRMIPVCQEVGSTIILGGPEPASYATEYLNFGAHIVVMGEGELTLEELIPHLVKHGRTQLHTIQGIIYQTGDRQVNNTGVRPYIKDLSVQPWPDREAIDMARYLDTWKTHHGLSSVSLITARGCPYTCTWCSHTVFGHTHRRRTVTDVANEVAWIQETYRPDQLWYADDVLTIAPRWFINYAAELKRRALHIPFECISRPDRLDEEIIAALAEMGCSRLWLGSESGSQRILQAMKRKTEVADLLAKSRMLRQAGIEVGMFIMLGYDGEEVADIEATADYLKRSDPDLFLTTVAYPIKGTAYYDAVADRVTTPLAWSERTDRDLQVNGRYSRRFYDHATRWLVNEVNLNKAWRAGQRHPLRLGKLWFNAQRGRWGMRLTQYQRETEQPGEASGRGWSAQERKDDGW